MYNVLHRLLIELFILNIHCIFAMPAMTKTTKYLTTITYEKAAKQNFLILFFCAH